MTKEFVSYEQAMALKELGFDYPTAGYYQHSRLIKQFPLTTADKQDQQFMRDNDCSAPLRQQALSWFYDKGFRYSIDWDWDTDRHLYEIFGPSTGEKRQFIFESNFEYDTYEAVENACIDKLIETVKNK